MNQTQTVSSHEHFMRLALAEAREALVNGEFPVGCVLVADNLVMASGNRRNSRVFQASTISGANELDHAEIVALRSFLNDFPEFDHRLVTLYSTLEPCLMCYGTLLINNFHKIVYAYEDAMGGGTSLPLDQLPPLYQEMQVTVIPNVLREESLSLFKSFFADPKNTYLQKTFLADYTMTQKNEE